MSLEVGKIYKHFKGMEVKIIAIAKHTETLEELVIYEELGKHEIWARPKEMFLSKVDKEKYPDVQQDYRFVLKEND